MSFRCLDVATAAGLEQGPKKGREQSFRCPRHDDQKPSLMVNDGKDTWLCGPCGSSGTPYQLAAFVAGLNAADKPSVLAWLREHHLLNGNGHHPAAASAIFTPYDYRDEHGQLLFQNVRVERPGEPKTFFARRPDGVGGWINKVDGVRLVPYALDRLVDSTRELYVVEGEKDSERLWTVPLPSTCNPFGAGGGWRDSYSQDLFRLAGVRRAYVIPDHDVAGHPHAQKVARSLQAAGIEVRVLPVPGLHDGPPAPSHGRDISNWLDAGHTADELRALASTAAIWTPPAAKPESAGGPRPRRRIVLTPASGIKIKPVKWLWEGRLPIASFNLLGGREGVGKTICVYTLGAQITRGTLPGIYFGTPRSVIVAATEDSWEYTIVPRLMAAGADLTRVSRVDVLTPEGTETNLLLPLDLMDLERAVREVTAALIILDPLLSRLDASLDTHKDAEVRVALEPLVALAGATDACVIGLIHVNKSSSSDVLNMLMASRAFAAVARAVLFAMVDPDDENRRLLGQAKNNLGRNDLPTLAFRIVGKLVATTDEGEVWTGQLEWLGESDRTIREAVASSADTDGDRTAASEAADWLLDYLTKEGGTAAREAIIGEGKKAGHTLRTIDRARHRLRVTSEGRGFPRKAYWLLPPSSLRSLARAGGLGATGATGTEETYQSNKGWTDNDLLSSASSANLGDPARGGATGGATKETDEPAQFDEADEARFRAGWKG